MGKIIQWPGGLPDPDKGSKQAGLTPFEDGCRVGAIICMVVSLVVLLFCLVGTHGWMSAFGWRIAGCIVLGLWASFFMLWDARVKSAIICCGVAITLILLQLVF